MTETKKQGDDKPTNSRKFCVTLVGLGAITIVASLCVLGGTPGEEISGILTPIAGIVGAYVIGQGYADGQAVKNGQQSSEQQKTLRNSFRGGTDGANETKGGDKNGKVSNTLGDGYDQSI